MGEIRRLVWVVFEVLWSRKKTVILRSLHNAYLQGAWSTKTKIWRSYQRSSNSTMETNKESNLCRMPLNVLLINLFGDGENLALRWYISVDLAKVISDPTFENLKASLSSFWGQRNSQPCIILCLQACILFIKLYNKDTSDPCSDLTDHNVTSRTMHLG